MLKYLLLIILAFGCNNASLDKADLQIKRELSIEHVVRSNEASMARDKVFEGRGNFVEKEDHNEFNMIRKLQESFNKDLGSAAQVTLESIYDSFISIPLQYSKEDLTDVSWVGPAYEIDNLEDGLYKTILVLKSDKKERAYMIEGNNLEKYIGNINYGETLRFKIIKNRKGSGPGYLDNNPGRNIVGMLDNHVCTRLFDAPEIDPSKEIETMVTFKTKKFCDPKWKSSSCSCFY